MKRTLKYLLLATCLLFTLPAVAQYDDEGEFGPPPKEAPTDDNNGPRLDRGLREKFAIGGFFNMTFGDVIYLDISPIVFFRPIERLQFGTGFIYQYINDRRFRPPYKSNLIGGRTFGRVFVWDNLFVQLEYNVINGDFFEVYNSTTGTYEDFRATYHTMFGGGGYNVPIGENSFLSLMVLVNLNTNLIYPQRRPFVNIGFGVGL